MGQLHTPMRKQGRCSGDAIHPLQCNAGSGPETTVRSFTAIYFENDTKAEAVALVMPAASVT